MENRDIQDLQLALMEQASFNGFDGPMVVKSLRDHRPLWEAALMTRMGDLIALRDLPDYWNVDTVYVRTTKDRAAEVETMARTWGADEIDFLSDAQTQALLGGCGRQTAVLRVWWD